MDYKYITENNLEDRQNYMYSEFCGAEFLQAYNNSRLSFIRGIEKIPDGAELHDTRKELSELKNSLNDARISGGKSWKDIIDVYVKKFEVSKRLFTEYNGKWKPTENASYEQFDIYMLLSECCLQVYRITECTKYFSCLLKIDDTLLSVINRMTHSEQKRLSWILEAEIEEYDKLAERLEVEA